MLVFELMQFTRLLGLSEFKLTLFTCTCFCLVCVCCEVVDTCFHVIWALIEAVDTRLCFCFCLGWRSAHMLLFGVCLFWGRSNMFLGMRYSTLVFFFSGFVFEELVGVCFCLYLWLVSSRSIGRLITAINLLQRSYSVDVTIHISFIIVLGFNFFRTCRPQLRFLRWTPIFSPGYLMTNLIFSSVFYGLYSNQLIYSLFSFCLQSLRHLET